MIGVSETPRHASCFGRARPPTRRPLSASAPPGRAHHSILSCKAVPNFSYLHERPVCSASQRRHPSLRLRHAQGCRVPGSRVRQGGEEMVKKARQPSAESTEPNCRTRVYVAPNSYVPLCRSTRSTAAQTVPGSKRRVFGVSPMIGSERSLPCAPNGLCGQTEHTRLPCRCTLRTNETRQMACGHMIADH